MHHVVTVTTRPRRVGEEDGTDYHFATESEFQQMLEKGELLECAQVYGRWYGVPKQQVRESIEGGNDAIVRVDVQGAATVKKLVPGAVLIFLASASVSEYEQRLRQRQTESNSELKVRIESIEEELKSLPLFDYLVVNRQGQLDLAASSVAAIMTAEKCRVRPRSVEVR